MILSKIFIPNQVFHIDVILMYMFNRGSLIVLKK